MSETMTFGDLEIAYDERVLEPREWTTLQSLWARDLLSTLPPGPVLELCAGAGHIGLLAVAGTGRRLVQVDVSEVACGYARSNAAAAGLADLVEVRCGPMDEVVGDGEAFALVVADPPWVPSAGTERFPDDPLLAIDGGDDGLDVAKTCLGVIAAHLVAGSSALLQVGSVAQVDDLARWLGDQPGNVLTVHEWRVHADRGVIVRLERT